MKLRIAAFLLLLPCLGCAPAEKPDFSAPLAGDKAESQWELILEDGANTVTFTGAMVVGLAPPHEGRLYIILPYGQTLAKCVINNGRAACEPAPGAGPMARKTAEPMARMAEAAFKAGKQGMFTSANQPPETLRGQGWRAQSDGDWLVYSEDGAGWKLKAKRNR